MLRDINANTKKKEGRVAGVSQSGHASESPGVVSNVTSKEKKEGGVGMFPRAVDR